MAVWTGGKISRSPLTVEHPAIAPLIRGDCLGLVITIIGNSYRFTIGLNTSRFKEYVQLFQMLSKYRDRDT